MASSKDIISRLLREGWIKQKTGGGSHAQYKKVEEFEEDGEVKKRSRRVTVVTPKKDIPIGTLKSIYRQAGWDWDL